MMFEEQELTIVADKEQVLRRLRDNRETHQKIVREARQGYVGKATEALRARLDDFQAGRMPERGLTFHDIHEPADATRDYDAAIETLSLHSTPTIELTQTQVRRYVLNDWDWTHAFIGANAAYSATARQIRDTR